MTLTTTESPCKSAKPFVPKNKCLKISHQILCMKFECKETRNEVNFFYQFTPLLSTAEILFVISNRAVVL